MAKAENEKPKYSLNMIYSLDLRNTCWYGNVIMNESFFYHNTSTSQPFPSTSQIWDTYPLHGWQCWLRAFNSE